MSRSRLVRLLVLLLVGCSEDAFDRTQAIVLVDAQPDVRLNAASLSLRVDAEGEETPALSESVAPRWPVKLALAPRAGDATRSYLVTAVALRIDGSQLALARMRSGFVAGEKRYVRLVLEDACVGVPCTGDLTCHAGACVDAEVDAEDFAREVSEAPALSDLLPDVPPADAGPDAAPGEDAGGAAGAGGLDGGPGNCTQPSAQRCSSAGVPERCEGMRWEALDECSATEACDSRPGATLGECLPLLEECRDKAPQEQECIEDTLRTCVSPVALVDTPCTAHSSCETTGGGPRCVCVEGYRDEDSACVDVDECRTGNGGCDLLVDCNNVPGSRTCDPCPAEYAGDGESGCRPRLESVVAWAPPDPTEITFDLGGEPPTVAFPLSVLTVSLRAEVSAERTIEIEGTPVASGATWMSPSLRIGSNPFSVTVAETGHPDNVYSLDVQRGMLEAYLKASNAEGADGLGQAIAVSGDTLVVGAFQEASALGSDPSDNSMPGAGAAYVFVRTGQVWTQEAYLKASHPGTSDQFAKRVAIDGDTIVVGAPGEDSDPAVADPANDDASGSGAAYVFVRSGSQWSQQALLKASNADPSDAFGESVAISGDTIVVGALNEDGAASGVDGDPQSEGAPESGAAYVFVRSGTAWAQQAYLKASNVESGDAFGRAAAIFGDTAAVSATSEDGGEPGVGAAQTSNAAEASGAVYVFTRSAGTWAQREYVKASNPGDDDQFGYRVVLDGSTLAVSAPYEDTSAGGIDVAPDESSSDTGAVYVFVEAAGVWSQQAFVKAASARGGDTFGIGLALAGDRLLAGTLDASSARLFGGDEDDTSLPASGAALFFERAAGSWSQAAYLKASNPGMDDLFGYSTALSGELLIVGARSEASAATGVGADMDNDDAPGAGAVYVFR